MCGEKGVFAPLHTSYSGSPPHVRGKAFGVSLGVSFCRITPACAGKRSSLCCILHPMQDHPRMCGEKLMSSISCSLIRDHPACAGKRQNTGCKAVNQRDHPRMCGEKASFVLVVWSRAGSPPHVRGKGAGFTFVPLILRITPACAGKRRCKAASVWLYWDHPRMCGEKWF